jgi:hypothetical protein
MSIERARPNAEGNEAYRDEPDISVRIVCIPKHGTRG